MRYLIFLLTFSCCFFVTSCGVKKQRIQEPVLVGLQLIDRNGFNETISTKERLDQYKRANFLDPQPYKKVVRVFQRNREGKTISTVTSYHDNGQICQYLEVVNGRAHGQYQEWHSNGYLKVQSHVVEGLGDLAVECMNSWVFDKESLVFDEQGLLIAKFMYDKGDLSGPCFYYYPNGVIKKKTIYHKNQEEGEELYFDLEGNITGKIEYHGGLKDGLSIHYGNNIRPKFEEKYEKGLLISALYYNPQGEVVSKIENSFGLETVFYEGALLSQHEYKQGKKEGTVYLYYPEGGLKSEYQIKEGERHGEEWIYYPVEQESLGKKQPKICLTWYEGNLQGRVKTWYKNGSLESERELYNNKKNGPSSAWYKNGQLMFLEEYEDDLLVKAIYKKIGENQEVSSIENGEGLVTLYDGDGVYLKKVSYRKGVPVEN